MYFSDLSSEGIAHHASRTVAVLPLAAVEQHGAHLPVSTDTKITCELARRLEKALRAEVVMLPTLWAGCSHHHLPFPGTLSISSETYVRVLCDLIESLLSSGFRRIFLLNGHGGNQIPFAEALYRIGLQRPDAWIAAQSYWKLAAPEIETQDFMATPALSHACEYETSMMLALAPQLVEMNHAKGEKTTRYSDFYDPLGYRPSLVEITETFDQMTANGAMGSPEMATAEKGERLLALFEAKLITFIKEFSTWSRCDVIAKNDHTS